MSKGKTAKQANKNTSRATGSLDILFGEKLRARRMMMAPKVSQSELANALGVTFQQVQKYERGANRVSASRLFEICEAMHVSLTSMFERDLKT